MRRLTNSIKFKALKPAIPLAALAGVLVFGMPAMAQTLGQGGSENSGDWLGGGFPPALILDRPVVPYQDYPFPLVQKGRLWQLTNFPRLEVDTFVPSGRNTYLPQRVKDLQKQANDLIAENKGAQAIALMERELLSLPEGKGQLKIGTIYNQGQGGVPKNEAMAFTWFERAAEYDPSIFRWLGHNTNEGMDMRLHYWSRGLSRGCTGCLEPLINAQNTVTTGKGRKAKTTKTPALSRDLALRYAIFATEVGHIDAPKLLLSVLNEIEINPESVSPQTLTLANKTRQEAALAAGSADSIILGLPQAAQQQLYSGLISGSMKIAADLIDAGKAQDAVSALILTRSTSRYLPGLIETLMRRYPNVDINVAAYSTLVLRSVEGGRPDHAAAAAVITQNRIKRFAYNGGKWQQQTFGGNVSAKTFARFGRHYRAIPTATSNYLNSTIGQPRAIDAVNKANRCLEKAFKANKGRGGRFEASAALRCRKEVNTAWSVSNWLNFYGLDEAGFLRLIDETRAAGIANRLKQERERKEAYNNRVKKYARAIRKSESDSNRRLGLPPKQYNNNFEVLEDSDRILAAAIARAQADGQAKPQNTGPTGGGISAFYQEYLEQKERIARGEAGKYTGPMESEAVCAIWSFARLPTCPQE